MLKLFISILSFSFIFSLVKIPFKTKENPIKQGLTYVDSRVRNYEMGEIFIGEPSQKIRLIIATSYYSGYIDIFFIDKQDVLLTKLFVGYDLRGAKFDSKKKNLYVCSINGLYKIPINIKELIEKYKKVSHETFH